MKGIVNTEEEITDLCVKLGIIHQAGAWYNYGDLKANGVPKFAELIRKTEGLYNELFAKVMAAASS